MTAIFKSTFVRVGAFALCAIAIACAATPAAARYVNNAAYYAVLGTINSERASSRVGAVALDPQLSTIAQGHANDMARRNYFSHVTPEGLDPFGRMRRAGYVYRAAGENIALNGNAELAAESIYNEPAHRAILLRPFFARVGIGLARTRQGVILVEDFSD